MKARNIIVAGAVAVGAGALAVKKLVSNPELNSKVKEDGKMNVSDRQKAYLQLNEDAEMVLGVIDEFAGVLPFDDKVSPEVIKREFGLSKNAFKRAVGHLLKEGKIEIREKRIYRK